MESLRANANYVRLADGRWSKITAALKEQIEALSSAIESMSRA